VKGRILFLIQCLTLPCAAAEVTTPQQPRTKCIVSTSATCPAGVSFEKAGYTIRKARIDNPFGFLPWVRAARADVERGVSALEGRPYVQAEVLHWADELDKLHLRSDTEQRVRADAIVTRVENCRDGALDVVYFDFSTEIAPDLSGTIESRRADVAAPQREAGTDQTTRDQGRSRFNLMPSAGYDRSEGLFAGGRFVFRPGSLSGDLPVDSLAVSGEGSAFMHRVSGTLAGSLAQDSSWLADAGWHLDYFNSSEPSHSTQLDRQRGAATLTAMTRPLGAWEMPVRFGGMFEGGDLDSRFFHPLPNDTVRNSGYWSSKLVVGTTVERDRHTLAASYGIEFASAGSAGLDWVKQVGEVVHFMTLPISDHRALQLESELTGGRIEIPGVVPLSARFFGGNREEQFIPDDSWTIRSNPVIRSIPANELSAARRGPGGTWFVSYNLTASVPVWRIPLVPLEMSRDPEFATQLSGAMKSATGVLQQEYSTDDVAYGRVVAHLGDLQAALDRLEGAVSAAQSASAHAPPASFKSCTRAIDRAGRRAANAAKKSKGAAQLGDIQDLLSVADSDGLLREVHAACVVALNAQLDDQAIAADGAEIERIRLDMEGDLAAVDQAAAKQKAEAEMRPVHRTMDVLVDETNVIAVSPVAIFDVAWIGPAESGYGTRYGAGGGLRVTLVNSVDFTLGYAVNINRHGGESAGAPFFAIQLRDLLN